MPKVIAKVVALPPRSRRPTTERTVPARILLFTGVRYIRDVEPAEAPAQRPVATAAAERLQA